MLARVEIEKSFDEGKAFSKEWNAGDFEEFFKDEGEYLDRLSKTTEEHGNSGEGFTVTYTVKLIK